jgi:predicted ester cyclase
VKAFPNLKWKLDRIFTQGDKVCAEFTFTGAHRGELVAGPRRSVAATGQSIRIQGVGIYVVRGGKIVDSKIFFDFGSLANQLQAKSASGKRKR